MLRPLSLVAVFRISFETNSVLCVETSNRKSKPSWRRRTFPRDCARIFGPYDQVGLEVEDASVITDVTFEEAEFLLNTLRSLFEELYVLEPESEKHRESLKQKDKEQQTRVREETKKNGKSDAPLL
jgi:hypothetical protein